MINELVASRSAAILVCANLYPLVMVLSGAWSVAEILVLYWFESAIIGVFNILKMMFADAKVSVGADGKVVPGDKTLPLVQKLFLCVFFTFHYGIFMGVHGTFISVLAHIPSAESFLSLLWRMRYAVLALFLSHAFSFFFNYIRNREYASSRIDMVMFSPYPRIIVMHITIIAGMWLSMVFKSNAVVMGVFVAMKIAVDAAAHLRERKKAAGGLVSGAPASAPI